MSAAVARAIAVDPEIDSLQHAIEEKAVLTIARRQPMAIDLREIIGAVRISNDLERVGDLAKNIGKRILPLAADVHPENLMLGVERMGELVLGRMREVTGQTTAKPVFSVKTAGETTSAGRRPACSLPLVGSKSVQIRSPVSGT